MAVFLWYDAMEQARRDAAQSSYKNALPLVKKAVFGPLWARRLKIHFTARAFRFTIWNPADKSSPRCGGRNRTTSHG
jgi:hypothetical protein